MASHADLAFIASYGGFQDRIRYPVMKEAIEAMSEAATTPNHALRVVYAKTVIAGTLNLHEWALAILTDAIVAAKANRGLVDNSDFGIPDADIEAAVGSLFDEFAGVAT